MYVIDINQQFLAERSEFALELMDAFCKVSERFYKRLGREAGKLEYGEACDRTLLRLEFNLRNSRYMELLLNFRSIGEFYSTAFDHNLAITEIETYLCNQDPNSIIDLAEVINAKLAHLRPVTSTKPTLRIVK